VNFPIRKVGTGKQTFGLLRRRLCTNGLSEAVRTQRHRQRFLRFSHVMHVGLPRMCMHGGSQGLGFEGSTSHKYLSQEDCIRCSQKSQGFFNCMAEENSTISQFGTFRGLYFQVTSPARHGFGLSSEPKAPRPMEKRCEVALEDCECYLYVSRYQRVVGVMGQDDKGPLFHFDQTQTQALFI
jgi:hypothetical protein